MDYLSITNESYRCGIDKFQYSKLICLILLSYLNYVSKKKLRPMELLSLAITFFVLAIIAALLGARGVAGISMEIARWFVIIFIILAIVSLIL